MVAADYVEPLSHHISRSPTTAWPVGDGSAVIKKQSQNQAVVIKHFRMRDLAKGRTTSLRRSVGSVMDAVEGH